jgi:hypothetical protein
MALDLVDYEQKARKAVKGFLEEAKSSHAKAD